MSIEFPAATRDLLGLLSHCSTPLDCSLRHARHGERGVLLCTREYAPGNPGNTH